MHPDLVTQLLVIALMDRVDNGQGPLVVSKQLLETPLAVHIVFDDQTEPGVVSLSIKSGKVLTGKVDNDIVEVVL